MRAKTKRGVARAVFMIVLFLVLGIVGGLEHGSCGLKEAAIWISVGMVVLIVAGAKGGLYRL